MVSVLSTGQYAAVPVPLCVCFHERYDVEQKQKHTVSVCAATYVLSSCSNNHNNRCVELTGAG